MSSTTLVLKGTMKLKAILSLIRPRTILWVSVGSAYGFATVLLGHFPPKEFTLFVISACLCHAVAIIWNDISDIEIDRASEEKIKRERPLVSGVLSKGEAIAISIVLYTLALLIGGLHSNLLLSFIIGAGILCYSYSFKPLYLSGHTYSSVLFWVISGIISYIFLTLFLSNESVTKIFDLNFYGNNKMLISTRGIMFIISTILYIGIGYILSKDLRDLDTDLLGGKLTFANTINLKVTLNILLTLSFIGILLWNSIFITEGAFMSSVFPICFLCLSFSSILEIYATVSSMLKNGFDKKSAISMSINWMDNYLLLQLFTILSFAK
ncbi:hypothetical protein GCM10028808_58980 [Spirosoma migulaei]